MSYIGGRYALLGTRTLPLRLNKSMIIKYTLLHNHIHFVSYVNKSSFFQSYTVKQWEPWTHVYVWVSRIFQQYTQLYIHTHTVNLDVHKWFLMVNIYFCFKRLNWQLPFFHQRRGSMDVEVITGSVPTKYMCPEWEFEITIPGPP